MDRAFCFSWARAAAPAFSSFDAREKLIGRARGEASTAGSPEKQGGNVAVMSCAGSAESTRTLAKHSIVAARRLLVMCVAATAAPENDHGAVSWRRHFAIVAWLVFAVSGTPSRPVKSFVELVKGHFTFLPRD